MSLSKELERLKYDKRLLDWNVSRGKFPKEELKKYLDSLPDLASNVDNFDLGEDRHSSSSGNGAAAGSASGGHQ